MSRKQAAEAYALAEMHEGNPRSVRGYVQGLTTDSVGFAVRVQPARPLLQLARRGLRPTVLPHATVVALAAASALRAQALLAEL
jgi:hypothetical protein